MTCGSCDHEFTVTTYVSYTFTSPEQAKEQEEKEGEDPKEDDALAE